MLSGQQFSYNPYIHSSKADVSNLCTDTVVALNMTLATAMLLWCADISRPEADRSHLCNSPASL